MHILLKANKKKNYKDTEVVDGLQARKAEVEEWFYNSAKNYYMTKFNEVFFDKDSKQEIFQESFLRLWTDIANGKIRVMDGILQRQIATGDYKEMTCSLNTFLMAIAKNNHREVLRKKRETLFDVFFEDAGEADSMVTVFDTLESEETQRKRIVDECIQEMSPRCLEILTLFYYEEKSLDEIMIIRKDKNESKMGLKTAKHKCMTNLRQKASQRLMKYNLAM